jgi:hypothetical protein
MEDRIVCSYISKLIGSRCVLKNDYEVKPKHSADKICRRLSQYASKCHWDAIILNKRVKKVTVKQGRLLSTYIYILRDSTTPCDKEMTLMFTPFAPYSPRCYRGTSFLYFVIPVLISLICFIVVDTVLHIKDEV